MTIIEAIIERAADGTYSIFCTNAMFSGMGDTVEEAKASLKEQMAFFKETAKAGGYHYPAFLDGEFTAQYKVDVISLMRYYVEKGILTLSCMEKITGINQKQL